MLTTLIRYDTFDDILHRIYTAPHLKGLDSCVDIFIVGKGMAQF